MRKSSHTSEDDFFITEGLEKLSTILSKTLVMIAMYLGEKEKRIQPS